MLIYLSSTARRALRSNDGNVTIIFALTALTLLYAMGMGVDYTSAARRRDKMNAVADAAALAAVTPTMMSQTSAYAQTVATNMFLGQASSLSGVTLTAGSPIVQVTDVPSVNGTVRSVSVSYTASSTDFFPTLLQAQTILIGGQSASQATTQPNINFYLMLDTSPSMAIAATPTDIATLVNATPKQSGCAFACHEAAPGPGGDNLGNPNNEDNYALARALGVTLRIDLVIQAVQNMMDTANSTMPVTNAVYRMALYSFDTTYHYIQSMTTPTIAKAQTSNVQLLEVYDENNLTSSQGNNDEDTNWDVAMSGLNAAMQTPGSGTNNLGDSPQEVLFIVTDGLIDEANGSSREMAPMGGAWCTTIKNRGIRIAILYTTYNPLPTNSFYNNNIKPFQPSISTSMQSCASNNLFYEVNVGGDISAAMNALFQETVGAAHLTQ